jgi:hypothetical protein
MSLITLFNFSSVAFLFVCLLFFVYLFISKSVHPR